ncbi:MAG: hypothetical protein QMC67_03390 [Candidatus Wallbacteria bacterium]
MNEFFEKVKQINSKYSISQRIKSSFNGINPTLKKIALNILPDESKLSQTAFLLHAAENELENPEMAVGTIVALELLRIGYEIRDKLVNKTPTFSTHFFLKDKLDMNYGLLISDVIISKGMSYLYCNCDRRMVQHIDEAINDIVNSRVDVAGLLKSDSLDLSKYAEMIVRSLGSVFKLGLLSIKTTAIINSQMQKSVYNLALNFAIACEFAEDFTGFFLSSGNYDNDINTLQTENTNIIFPLLLLNEVVSGYESTTLKNILINLKNKGGPIGHKELWRVKNLMKKYNVTDYILRKISDHIDTASAEIKVLGWRKSDEMTEFITLLLRSNWDINYISK